MAQPRTSRGAHALGDDHRKAGGWWKWLLAALLLIAAAIILIALLSGGDDNDKKASNTPATTTPAAPSAAASSPGAGTLTAQGQSLLGASGGAATPAIGATATGAAVKVLSVDAGDGFFVGTSNADRVYVEYGSAVGADEPAQDYKAAVGDTVDLVGPVRPAPQDPAKTLKLSAEDAETVTSQGFFVNAKTVTKTS